MSYDPDLPREEQLVQADYNGHITALGKIFVNMPVDLKITRLFLFGMAFKCMR
jgi:hypothetical protein